MKDVETWLKKAVANEQSYPKKGAMIATNCSAVRQRPLRHLEFESYQNFPQVVDMEL